MDITENNRSQSTPDTTSLTIAESSDASSMPMTPATTRPPLRLRVMPYFELLTTAWKYGHGARVQLVLFYLAYIPAIGFSLVQPYTFGQTINALQAGGRDMFSNVCYWLA